MTTQPLVSIAMCTYNGERFLKEQLDSLVAQDYRPLEIQVFDDRSTDRTFEILKAYEAEYDFIKAHKNTSNLGFIKNFEAAISACSGEFIALCDQDDVWFPHKISTLVQEIGTHSLIYSHTALIDSENQPQGDFLPDIKRLSGPCNRSLILGNCVTGHTCLFPRRLLEHVLPFPAGIDYHDHWIAFVAATIGTIHYLNRPLSSYRQHEENLSFDPNRKKNRKHDPSLRRFLGRSRKVKTALLKKASCLEAFQELPALSPEDRRLIITLANEIKRSRWKRYNIHLEKLLKATPELLNLFHKKEYFIARLCKGALLRF